MDSRHLQNPIHYAVLLLLAVQWGRVLAMPLQHQGSVCNLVLKRAIGLTETLHHEASQLLDSYVLLNDFPAPDSTPEHVPDAAVADGSPAERLHSIAVKERLFHWHLAVVEEDNAGFWGDESSSIQQTFKATKSRLSDHFKTIGELLKEVDPDYPAPSPPETPDLQIDGGFAKKLYGSGVLANLKALTANVRAALGDAAMCATATTVSSG